MIPNPAFGGRRSYWTPYLNAKRDAEEAAAAATEPAPAGAPVADYATMDLPTLRATLAARGVDVPKTWNKGKLIKELKAV